MRVIAKTATIIALLARRITRSNPSISRPRLSLMLSIMVGGDVGWRLPLLRWFILRNTLEDVDNQIM